MNSIAWFIYNDDAPTALHGYLTLFPGVSRVGQQVLHGFAGFFMAHSRGELAKLAETSIIAAVGPISHTQHVDVPNGVGWRMTLAANSVI